MAEKCPKCGGTEISGGSYERGEAGILEKGPVQRERLVYSCLGCGYTLRKSPTLDQLEDKPRPGGFSETRRRARNKKRRR